MTKTIEEDMEFVVYFVRRHEDFSSRVAAYEAAQRVQECLTQTRRQNTDLQENNTKLVLDGRKLKFGLDVADAERKLTKARITKLQSRIADLEAQLAEARESAVG